MKFTALKKVTFKEIPETVEAVLRRVINLDDYRGRRGRRGARGTDGADGADGKDGSRGVDGADGLPGQDGADGLPGKRGGRGPMGAVGRQGQVGPTGPQGEKGDTGPMPAHQWKGGKIRFQMPNGQWGRYVSLKGDTGGRGAMGRAVKESFGSITLNGTDLEFKKLGALGPDISVDLSALAGGAVDVNNAQRVDDTVNGTVLYVGDAVPGTLDAAASWRIKRITFTGQDSVTEWAGGVETRDKVWNNRLSETYS